MENRIADRNIPLRSLAAAIIMTYIEENESNWKSYDTKGYDN